MINLFKAKEASYFSGVYNFFSVAPKADSLVDKVLKIFIAIVLAIKYSVDLITKPFREVTPKTTSEKLAFAANFAVSQIKKSAGFAKDFAVKNQAIIIKIVIEIAFKKFKSNSCKCCSSSCSN